MNSRDDNRCHNGGGIFVFLCTRFRIFDQDGGDHHIDLPVYDRRNENICLVASLRCKVGFDFGSYKRYHVFCGGRGTYQGNPGVRRSQNFSNRFDGKVRGCDMSFVESGKIGVLHCLDWCRSCYPRLRGRRGDVDGKL